MTLPDVVYAAGPTTSDELRYSLRSLINLPHGEVWIVGQPPSWYCGPRLHLRQNGTKHRITNKAMRLACEADNVSDPFIWFNDDFFIMRPGGPLPVFHAGPIEEVVAQLTADGLDPARSPWVRGMQHTHDLLVERGITNPLGYELHVPLLIHKEKMLEALDIVDEHGGQKRTLYGNLANLGGRKMADVKVRNLRDPIPADRFLSSMNTTFTRVRPLLARTFPTPAKWELH